MTYRAVVGWDADGVKYDYEDSVRRFLHHMHGFRLQDMPPATRWSFYHDWLKPDGTPMSTEEFIDFNHQGVDAGVIFRHGLPMYRSREAMQRLVDAGCEIVVITSRFFGSPGAAEESTRWWLDTHQYPYHRLILSENKAVVPTDFMVDDNVDNYDTLDASGCEAWLIDRPWNREWNGQPVLDRRRVDCLDCFVDRVLGATDPVAAAA